MWKQFGGFVMQALSWGRQTQRNTEDVARVQQTLTEMVRVLHHFDERLGRLESRLDHSGEVQRHEREKQELRFQLALERLERRLALLPSLPPPPSSSAEET